MVRVAIRDRVRNDRFPVRRGRLSRFSSGGHRFDVDARHDADYDPVFRGDLLQ